MAKNKGGNTVNSVWEITEPLAEELGLTIWDIRFVKEGADYYLRIYIEKKDGEVGIDDCVALTRALNKPLDEKDPIDMQYILEVSSPGVERELTKEEHFNKYIGAAVKVKMIRPIENIGKEFAGVLKDATKQTVIITDHSGENTIEINKKDTVWVKLDDFD